ncbi:MAG: HDIG domain-containing protein [Tannerella sp.]|jgi:putative nucleotidyltransferase with HDIG domain|nr:HDIG domain-containing protein [Tannerella sp.]
MKSRNTIIQPIIYFVFTAILIAYFFPREVKFRYQFFEGKPWQYDLLTAPGDFPIYKTEEEVKAEKDSVIQNFIPYYQMNPEVKRTQLEKLRSDFQAHLFPRQVNQNYLFYIESQLVKFFDKGILTTIELDLLTKEKPGRIYTVINSLSEIKQIKELYTVKSAYEAMLNEAPGNLDKTNLTSCNLNNYLAENISYDENISQKMLNELLQNVSLSKGMVQAGERIIDRGEVIDGRTFGMLRSLKVVHEARSGGSQRQGIIRLGQLILIIGILFCCAFYLATFRPDVFYRRRNIIFILLCIIVFCILAEMSAKYNFSIYIIPFAILPIVVRTFFDSHTALFTHLIAILLSSLVTPFPHEFLIMQIISGIIVIFTLKELSQRSQLIRCAFFVFLSYALIYLSLALYQEGDMNKINWTVMIYFGINFILLMFSYILIYIFEKTFGFISTITLVELSNINAPLLKKLSETCPGTFQHSMQVSTLAFEAGAQVGANTQLIRTGALYHDIGKLSNPAFFTENQKGTINPHDKLTFEESAQIITNHVSEGIKLAEKASIPQAIIDFIRTHHGTGKALYFYNSFKNAFPDQPIHEEAFTYPGPNPFSKETAILMLADAVEATSRSLAEYTDETIKDLVNRIIDRQISLGLLQNTPLTFNDIGMIKASFIDKLKTMYHTRINYPDLK